LDVTVRLLLRLLHLVDDVFDRPGTASGEVVVDGDEIVRRAFHAELVPLFIAGGSSGSGDAVIAGLKKPHLRKQLEILFAVTRSHDTARKRTASSRLIWRSSSLRRLLAGSFVSSTELR
ncbi:hypothetical protein ISCGN_003753, partial [Ixodes scapularis]